ncbi:MULTISPECIES: AraC family transcriptional regulator [unclassified Rhizobium]|uniref:AraC family transcriptional regulator n=1 Tax=unclassified Rhizobium TaxID=2613769 RepID=UPI00180A5219|nr:MULTISPECIES: AraC family transcriptional regulator [unclassified Rhizobium]MBB3543633.1 AraC-like DNA-binding protein [Rhizobium sp. BK399]MCS3741873.1 AraC-like DNA-binding protein [Rhizobium sp. BK661]MCS4095451.1 AraC-like DNA-binding protein [Rhizobium sp. BK176]
MKIARVTTDSSNIWLGGDNAMAGRGKANIQSLINGPTAWGLATRLAVRHLERAGMEVAPLLLQSGLSSVAIAERQRIHVTAQMRFLELVGYALKNAWIGLTLAKECDLRELGMLYYVAASSHDLGDAFKRLSRYVSLGNEALVVRLGERPACSIEVSYAGVQRHRDRHQMELLAFAVLRLCRKLVGRDLSPHKVRFIHHRTGDLSQIRRTFGCEVEFDAEMDEIIFNAGTLELPVVGDDPFLNELILKMCDEAMTARLANTSRFRTIVENNIAPLLPHAEATIKAVAKRLGLSERTFARKLAAEGISFGEILDQMRRDLAIRYLEDDLQASQIAWLLGFHHPSSFSHACRRWTGKSPLEFRRAPVRDPAE